MGSDDAEEEVATVGVAAKTTETRLDKPERESRPRLANAPDFGPRYRVIGVLGRGGMGEVFRAFDADLREEVALKVVRSDQTELDAHGRFRREIALARKVTDPNVLRVYDLGDYQGLRYLSMEFVDGESLAAIMRKEKLPLERAVAIFRQVCKGLVAAHAQGVVHRDLKPQNVLVDKQGRVRVADFGLARSIGDSGLTASGAILGSPAYMSPEQVKGDPADERSDIYSLGVMLYQLVTGEAPFKADTPHALMEMRLHKKPRPLRELAPNAPEHVEAIVMRCLEVDPANRYRSVSDLLGDLDGARAPAPTPSAMSQTDVVARKPRWVMPAIGAAVVAAGAIAFAVWPRSEPAANKPPATAPASTHAGSTSTPSEMGPVPVLVLGIENRSGDTVFERSLEMVVEQALRRSRKLDPIMGVRLQQLAASLDPAPAADELGAAVAKRDGTRVLVMRGTVTTVGQGVSITLTTTDAVSKQTIVSSAVTLKSTADVVDETARLADELRTKMGESLEGSGGHGLSSSLDAVREFALGLDAHRSGHEQTAQQHLERAIKHDPGFARAHAILASVHRNLNRPADTAKEFKLALGALDRMSERDRLKFLGDYHYQVTKQTDRAVASLEELMKKWPDDIAAANNLVNALGTQHDMAKALEWTRRNVKRHPRVPIIRANQPGFELQAGNFDEAVKTARAVIAEFPKPYSVVHLYHAVAQVFVDPISAPEIYDRFAKLEAVWGAAAHADFALAQGRLDNALAHANAALADPKDASSTAELARVVQAEVLLRRGDKAGARAAVAKVVNEVDTRFLAALLLVGAGDEKRAMQIAKDLAGGLGADPRAYAKLIEAEAARRHGKPREATILAKDALAISNVWYGHFILGLASLDAGDVAEAFTELQECHKRRGEIAISIVDLPGVRYALALQYWLARTQEALGSPEAAAGYRTFLATQIGGDPKDPLIADATARLAKLTAR